MSDQRASRFASRLRLLRERHHWSQERLAERLQVSVATINRWEHAKSYPRAEQRSRICELLG
ncbi:MAG TPA: helix-turn-helix transcriptional regulator, partial [Ktedonobacterales bacterium]